jgi:hypothetical protein
MSTNNNYESNSNFRDFLETNEYEIYNKMNASSSSDNNTLHSQVNQIKQMIITNKHLQNASNAYTQKEKYHLNEYVKNGMEINQRLREKIKSNIASRSRSKTSMDQDKLIHNIDNVIKKYRVQDLFPRLDGDFIEVYRVQSKPFNNDTNQGYVSTSSVPIPMSSMYKMKILVPKHEHVGVVNITEQSGRGKNKSNTKVYEIILPRYTNLTLLRQYENEDIYTTLIPEHGYANNQSQPRLSDYIQYVNVYEKGKSYKPKRDKTNKRKRAQNKKNHSMSKKQKKKRKTRKIRN